MQLYIPFHCQVQNTRLYKLECKYSVELFNHVVAKASVGDYLKHKCFLSKDVHTLTGAYTNYCLTTLGTRIWTVFGLQHIPQ